MSYIVATKLGTTLTPNKVSFNNSVASASVADQVSISGVDIAAGRRSLAIGTEEAVAVDVVTESTHTLSVVINGTTYKILLATP